MTGAELPSWGIGQTALRVGTAVAVGVVLAITGRPVAAAIALGAGLVALAVGTFAPSAMARMDLVLRSSVKVGLSWLFFVPVGALLGIVAYLLTVVVRVDPLTGGPRGRRSAGWTPASNRQRPWTSFAHEIPPEHRHRGRRALVGIGLLLPVLVLVNRLTGIGPDRATARAPGDLVAYSPYGHEKEPFAPRLWDEMQQFVLLFDPVFGQRMSDGHTSMVNVTDRIRASYVPPGAADEVWFFGGSTTFGTGQRDQHTIPSEVARQAAAHGRPIKVVNFGVPASVNIQEAQLFAYELTRRPPPKAVVFYDGCNDMGLAVGRVLGTGFSDRPTAVFAPQMRTAIEAQNNVAPLRPGEDGGSIDLTEAIELGADQYRSGTEMAKQSAKARSVPVLFYWQPTLPSKRPNATDRPVLERVYGPRVAGRRSTASRALHGIAARSGVHPIDLTDSLDGFTTPVYLDECHTNEAGARVVARAIWPGLAATLGGR